MQGRDSASARGLRIMVHSIMRQNDRILRERDRFSAFTDIFDGAAIGQCRACPDAK